MNMKMKKRLGFTVLELLAVVLLVGVFISVMAIGFRSSIKAKVRAEAKGALESEMGELVSHILKVGRIAQNCEKVTSGLECVVNFSVPPTGTWTTIRFILADADTHATTSHIDYQSSEAGVLVTKRSYLEMAGFDVCDDATVVANLCTIGSAAINAGHASNLAAIPETSRTEANRFFRFRIRAVSQSQEATDSQIQFQSAFYVRNPGPFPGLTYQVGGLN